MLGEFNTSVLSEEELLSQFGSIRDCNLPSSHVKAAIVFLSSHSYQIVDVIGASSTSLVLRIRQIEGGSSSDKDIAVKVSICRNLDIVYEYQRLHRVSRSSQNEENSVIVHEILYDDSNETLFVLMDLCLNGDLGSFAARSLLPLLLATSETSSIAAAGLALKVMSSVKRFHDDRLVHGDINPSNFLVDSNGNVKICVHPAARFLVNGVARSGTDQLAVHYASSRQLEGQGSNEADDLFSLAAVLLDVIGFNVQKHVRLMIKLRDLAVNHNESFEEYVLICPILTEILAQVKHVELAKIVLRLALRRDSYSLAAAIEEVDMMIVRGWRSQPMEETFDRVETQLDDEKDLPNCERVEESSISYVSEISGSINSRSGKGSLGFTRMLFGVLRKIFGMRVFRVFGRPYGAFRWCVVKVIHFIVLMLLVICPDSFDGDILFDIASKRKGRTQGDRQQPTVPVEEREEETEQFHSKGRGAEAGGGGGRLVTSEERNQFEDYEHSHRSSTELSCSSLTLTTHRTSELEEEQVEVSDNKETDDKGGQRRGRGGEDEGRSETSSQRSQEDIEEEEEASSNFLNVLHSNTQGASDQKEEGAAVAAAKLQALPPSRVQVPRLNLPHNLNLVSSLSQCGTPTSIKQQQQQQQLQQPQRLNLSLTDRTSYKSNEGGISSSGGGDSSKQVDIVVFKNGYFIGHVKDKQPHGEGKMFFHKGNRYEGSFIDGLYEGKGVYYYAIGNKYIGSWKQNLRDGWGMFRWADGTVYNGEYKKNVKCGKGTLTFLDGEKYSGCFVGNTFHGQGTYYFSDGAKFQGEFENGEITHDGTFYKQNGEKVLDHKEMRVNVRRAEEGA